MLLHFVSALFSFSLSSSFAVSLCFDVFRPQYRVEYREEEIVELEEFYTPHSSQLQDFTRNELSFHVQSLLISHPTAAIKWLPLLPLEQHHPLVRARLQSFTKGQKPDFIRNVQLQERTGTISCGSCKHMSSHHINATILPLEAYFKNNHNFFRAQKELPIEKKIAGKFVLVLVKGELIGAIKTTGDHEIEYDPLTGIIERVSTPSFLSFRNIKDDQGRWIYIAGGVYDISEKIHPAFIQQIQKQGPFKPQRPRTLVIDEYYHSFQVGILHLDAFSATPNALLVNRPFFHNESLIRRLGFQSELSHMISDKKNLQQTLEIYNNLAARIHFVRRELEKELKIDPELNTLRGYIRSSLY